LYWWLRLGVLALCLGISVYTDVTQGKIRNLVTLPGIVAGLILSTLQSGTPGTWDSLLGLAVGVALPLPLFAIRQLGGGDVKLLGLVGALLGRDLALRSVLCTALCGGLLACLLLLLRRKLLVALRNMGRSFLLRALGADLPPADGPEKQALPYAVAIALGTLLALTAGRRVVGS
jgi:prepilin peptidase CpaA